MDAIAWLRISIAGYSLGGILLIIAIFMFFKMNIPAIIGDLSGKTAARKIQEIREQNNGNKRHTPKAFNLEQTAKSRGLRTGGLGSRGKTGRTGTTVPTGKTGTTAGFNETLAQGSLATEVLPELDATVLLSDDTELLSMETEVLEDGTELPDETTLLDESVVSGVEFKIVKNLMVIHTKEVI